LAILVIVASFARGQQVSNSSFTTVIGPFNVAMSLKNVANETSSLSRLNERAPRARSSKMKLQQTLLATEQSNYLQIQKLSNGINSNSASILADLKAFAATLQ